MHGGAAPGNPWVGEAALVSPARAGSTPWPWPGGERVGSGFPRRHPSGAVGEHPSAGLDLLL
eukprot:12726852-Alexandrium_andersonii.AAC.1